MSPLFDRNLRVGCALIKKTPISKSLKGKSINESHYFRPSKVSYSDPLAGDFLAPLASLQESKCRLLQH